MLSRGLQKALWCSVIHNNYKSSGKEIGQQVNRSNYFAAFLSQAIVFICQMCVCQIPAGVKDRKVQVKSCRGLIICLPREPCKRATHYQKEKKKKEICYLIEKRQAKELLTRSEEAGGHSKEKIIFAILI